MDLIASVDRAVVEFMPGTMKCGFLDATMPYATLLGEAGIFWIICALVFLFIRRSRKIGFVCAVSMSMDFILCNLVIKKLVARARPNASFWNSALIFMPTDYSFPSGHTAISFAAAAAVFSQNKKLGSAAFALAALVGFSRVYLCVHWLSDVIAGALVGTACAVAAYFIVKTICKNRKAKN